jgi:iron-sulfur cluster assembly protein
MAITLTEKAAEKIRKVAQEHKLAGTPHLRIAVKGGGCSGFSYVLDLCAGPVQGDEVFATHDVNIVCDPKSYLYLNGTEIDFADNLLGGGFTFNNPQAKGTCGCGASFRT